MLLVRSCLRRDIKVVAVALVVSDKSQGDPKYSMVRMPGFGTIQINI